MIVSSLLPADLLLKWNLRAHSKLRALQQLYYCARAPQTRVGAPMVVWGSQAGVLRA